MDDTDEPLLDDHDVDVEILATDINSAGEISVLGTGDTSIFPSGSESEKPDTEDEKEEANHVALLSQLPTFYTAIRIAPLTALFALAYGMNGPAFTELLKIRVCEQGLNFTDEVCEHLNEEIYVKQADQVRTSTAQFQLYNTLIGSIPAVLFSVFLGSWSDQYGRKLPMLLPFFGTFFAHAYTLFCAYYPIHPSFMLISPVISSISGGHVITFMAIFSYIGDYTTNLNRTLNIVIIDGLQMLVGNAGTFLGGYVMQFGIVVPFYIVCGLQAVAFLYVVLVIRDRQSHKKMSGSKLRSLFTIRRVMENVEMLKKNRPGNARLHILLILFCMFLSSVCLIGDGSIMQLFLEFRPFNWTVEFYTLFSSISGTISSVTMVIAVVVLRKVFAIRDTMLALLATLSAVTNFFGYAIAQMDWMIYVAAAFGVFKMVSIVCIRSMLAGMVNRQEIGKIMSAVSSLHSLTPLLGSAIFTNVFAFTADWWPGLCFVLGAFLLVPVFAIFCYVDVLMRRVSYSSTQTFL